MIRIDNVRLCGDGAVDIGIQIGDTVFRAWANQDIGFGNFGVEEGRHIKVAVKEYMNQQDTLQEILDLALEFAESGNDAHTVDAIKRKMRAAFDKLEA